MAGYFSTVKQIHIWFTDKQINIFLNKRCKNTPKNKQEKTTDIRRILLYMP